MITPHATPQTSEASSSARNRALVLELYERVINERKLDLLPEYVSEDYVGPRGEHGPAGFSRTIEGLLAGVPDLRFEVKEVFATDERAAIRWSWSGAHTGALFGIPPSNQHVTNTGIAVYTFARGKIVASALETDRLGLLQQIGLVPPNLGAPRVVER